MTAETIRRYKGDLDIISEFLKQSGYTLLDIDRNNLKNVLGYLTNKRGGSCSTLSGYFSALSGCYQYLIWEGIVDSNPILPFRKRYLRNYGKKRNSPDSEKRKLISVEEMAMLIGSILDPRDKAIITLFAKTGIRRGELIDIDLEDVDWLEQSIIRQRTR